MRAEHSSEDTWRHPATGKDELRPGGEPVGWIIELENGFKTYPIGGNCTINANLGALAVRDMIKPKYALPMHYGTFPILAGKPEDFAKGLEGSGIRVVVPQPGDAVTF